MIRTVVIAVLAAVCVLAMQKKAEVFRASDGATVAFEEMLRDLRSADVIFIGESHGSRNHHELQERIIRALHDSGLPVAIGLEMFRADDQRTLDAWIAGSLERDRFVRRYYENWRMPWPLYEDIFLYARDHRIPLVGLNIPEEIGTAVANKGFASLTEQQRALIPPGITCDVGPRYRAFIREAYGKHAPKPDRSFNNFCEAQLLWDQAMAWHIAGFRTRHSDRLLVVLTGIGHAWRRGIPEQLTKYAALTSRVVLPEIPGEMDPSTVTAGDADYLVP